jgi:hypothetical protein
MDGTRFDDLTRVLAGSGSRRRFLGRLGAGMLGGVAALLGISDTAARCRPAGRTCSANDHCCSRFCGDRDRTGDGQCEPCEGVVCDELCCPPETIGCTENVLPDGTALIGCLCPEGTLYDRARNECRPCANVGGTCRADEDCCDGVCAEDGRCVDRSCCSPEAVCDADGTAGICCAGPMTAECCCPSSPTEDDGFVHCCTPGVDCVGDLSPAEARRRCPRGWARAHYSPDCSVDLSDEVLMIDCCAVEVTPCCLPGTTDVVGWVCPRDGTCRDELCPLDWECC